MEPPAIVISKGAQGLAVTRGLGEKGVRVIVLHWTDHDVARLSRHASESVQVPHPEHDGAAFVETLVSLADRFGGGVLIPTADEAVRDLARNKQVLEQHYIVACPDADVVERFIDKRYTYELAAERGIPIPKTLVPEGPQDLDAFDKEVMYPCLVKPRESHRYVWHFETKMEVVHTLAEMRTAYQAAVDAGRDGGHPGVDPRSGHQRRQPQRLSLGRRDPGRVHRPQDPARATALRGPARRPLGRHSGRRGAGSSHPRSVGARRIRLHRVQVRRA
jgi:predicted ATP-grasp superfamily ATP-dependent carboligase